MRYALGLFLAILGPTALTVLPGCGSNGNLGGGLPDAATPLGGAGGSTSVPTNTGGTLASGGAVQVGISITGGAVQGGISITALHKAQARTALCKGETRAWAAVP